MQETLSTGFKKFFLLEFTKELIKHSAKGEVIQLEKLIDKRNRDKKEKFIKSVIHEMNLPRKEMLDLKEEEEDFGFRKRFDFKSRTAKATRPPPVRMRLLIPETQLPPHLQYLRPIATSEAEIDLGKLNPLVKDPAVKVIECNGPEEYVLVGGTMGTKPTDILLSKEELTEIINKFSEFSKIPVQEGVYKVVAGGLILSAVVSEVIGSKFIIKKIVAQEFKNYPSYLAPPSPIRV
ncbi:MAG: hypothetical protein NTU63_03275 [Candidatus Pacearchaeota archaeon]|nr:hypothetical protein [Candidatus Pacearchaeota archaeon]